MDCAARGQRPNRSSDLKVLASSNDPRVNEAYQNALKGIREATTYKPATQSWGGVGDRKDPKSLHDTDYKNFIQEVADQSGPGSSRLKGDLAKQVKDNIDAARGQSHDFLESTSKALQGKLKELGVPDDKVPELRKDVARRKGGVDESVARNQTKDLLEPLLKSDPAGVLGQLKHLETLKQPPENIVSDLFKNTLQLRDHDSIDAKYRSFEGQKTVQSLVGTLSSQASSNSKTAELLGKIKTDLKTAVDKVKDEEKGDVDFGTRILKYVKDGALKVAGGDAAKAVKEAGEKLEKLEKLAKQVGIDVEKKVEEKLKGPIDAKWNDFLKSVGVS